MRGAVYASSCSVASTSLSSGAFCGSGDQTTDGAAACCFSSRLLPCMPSSDLAAAAEPNSRLPGFAGLPSGSAARLGRQASTLGTATWQRLLNLETAA